MSCSTGRSRFRATALRFSGSATTCASAATETLSEPSGVLRVVVAAVLARLDRLPPLAVRPIPLDGLLEPARIERVGRRPAEAAQLGRVDRVAAVVARPVL